MTDRLDAAVRPVAPITGVSVGTPGDSSTVRIDFRPEATPEQRAAAQAVVDGFDWSAGAQTAWELARKRTAALASFNTRSDETALAVRALLNAYIYLANNHFQTLGQSRILAADIFNFIAANPTVGDPV